jgi:hypothetical protein
MKELTERPTDKYIRLQIKGGNDFNFLLPANPAWRISTLQDHMIKIYNEISATDTPNTKAIKIKGVKRNGYYIAPSLKVGDTFDDWDELHCHIVLQTLTHEEITANLHHQREKNRDKHERKNKNK